MGCLRPWAQGAVEPACPVEVAWAHRRGAELPAPRGQIRLWQLLPGGAGCFPPGQGWQTGHPSKTEMVLGCSSGCGPWWARVGEAHLGAEAFGDP